MKIEKRATSMIIDYHKSFWTFGDKPEEECTINDCDTAYILHMFLRLNTLEGDYEVQLINVEDIPESLQLSDMNLIVGVARGDIYPYFMGSTLSFRLDKHYEYFWRWMEDHKDELLEWKHQKRGN